MSSKNKNKNVAVVVLDMTGSMGGQEDRVVSSMNEYVQALPKTCDLTVFLFNSGTWDQMYSGKVSKWTPMEKSRYVPHSTTPLYDSIAKAIKYAEGQVSEGDKVMIMIDTDGQENASTDFNHLKGGQEAIKKMVKECEDKGWAFKFMANGIDTQAAHSVSMISANLGIRDATSTTYAGRTMAYASAGRSTRMYFAGDDPSTAGTSGDNINFTSIASDVSAPPKPTTDKPKVKPKVKLKNK